MPFKPTASISKLTFSGGQSFDLSQNEKIILVGPNNSGKSQSLREIFTLANNGDKERTVVIAKMEIAKNGSVDDLKSFLESESEYVTGNYSYKRWQMPSQQLGLWNKPYLLGSLIPGFMKNIAADERLKICEQQSSIPLGGQKSKPQHILYDDEALMRKISDLFKRAFGKDLMFDFRGGRNIPIHVGKLPDLEGVVDRVGDAYVKAIRENPLLDQQGGWNKKLRWYLI